MKNHISYPITFNKCYHFGKKNSKKTKTNTLGPSLPQRDMKSLPRVITHGGKEIHTPFRMF